jgi:hypothetical protein
MPTVRAQSHIVCLPSYYGEGVPKILLEAASIGRPIVTTDMPGCREAVTEGDNGLLVPARDAGALAAALKMLLNDPTRRKDMGQRGRERAEQEFSEEHVVSQTLDIYRLLLDTAHYTGTLSSIQSMTRVATGVTTDVAVLLIDCGDHGLRMKAVADNPDHAGIPGFHHIQTHTHECQQHIAAGRLAVGQLPVDEANLAIVEVHLEVPHRQPVIDARQQLHDGIAVRFRNIFGDPEKQGEILSSGSRH